MQEKNLYSKMTHIVHAVTHMRKSCPHCRKIFNDFDEDVNHYIKEHGYKLLHVGTETQNDNEGRLWQSTAAVLGRE